jgi:hypothetical protein
MIDKITIKLLDKWNARKRKSWKKYSNDSVRGLLGGKEFVTPLEVLDLKIPLRDKIWVLLRQEVLGDQFLVPVDNAIDRAKKCVNLRNITSAIPAYAAYPNDVTAYAAVTIIVYVIADAAAAVAVSASSFDTAVDAFDVNTAVDAFDVAFVAELEKQLDDIKTILKEKNA